MAFLDLEWSRGVRPHRGGKAARIALGRAASSDVSRLYQETADGGR
jgi:hypothetical protein